MTCAPQRLGSTPQLALLVSLLSGLPAVALTHDAAGAAAARPPYPSALVATLPADQLALPYRQYRFSGVDQQEAEALLAEATAAVYFADWGEVLVLAQPEQRGATAAWARLAGEAHTAAPPWELAEHQGQTTLVAFLAEIAQRYPGLETGALGRYLIKYPTVRKASPLASPPRPAPPLEAQSIALSEGFEGDPWSRWQRQDDNGGQYRWEVTACDAHGGTRSADAVRGGTAGVVLGCAAAYPVSIKTRILDGSCENFQGAQQAWLDLYATLYSESGYDPLAVYFAGSDDNLYGFGFSGNTGSWIRLIFNLRQWYALGDLAANACNRLALDFESDNIIAPGFGVRVDDITIRTGEAPPLTCGAAASPASGPAPLAVQFTGSVSGAVGPSYDWWFDDEDSSAATQNASHTYAAPGEYDPCFSITSGSDSCSACTHVSVTSGGGGGTQPLPGTYTGTTAQGKQMEFDVDAYGRLTRWKVYFSCGAASGYTTTTSASGCPVTDGSFSCGSATCTGYGAGIKLMGSFATSTSASGTLDMSVGLGSAGNCCSLNALSWSATLQGGAPLTAGATGIPSSGPAPLAVQFTGAASGGTPPYSYSWGFGDGTPGSSQQNPAHTYTSAGAYIATVTVTDAASATASAGATITVTQPGTPLVASASADVTTGVAPLVVHLTGGASGGTPPYGYSWNFGDGSLGSSQQSPTHTYAAAGSYAATLTVTDAAAGSATASVAINATQTSTYRYLVPAVAHNPGYGGTLWRTDIAAVGADDADAEITLTFRSGGTSTSQSATLPANATVEWANILETVFAVAADANRSGSVEIVSSAPLSVTSRTFNQGSAGTYGQYLPALTEADALASGQKGVLPQLKKNGDFRTNIGAVNLGQSSCTVAIRLHDASGAQVGSTRTLGVAPAGWAQENDVFALAGAGEHDVAYATVEVQTAGGKAWVYASVVDGHTGDPTTIPVIVPLDAAAAALAADPPATSAIGEAGPDVPDIVQTSPPDVPPLVLSTLTDARVTMANAYAGYWYGTTSQSLPVNIHVSDSGQVDYLTLRLRMSFVTFTCTGNASADGPFPLAGSSLDTTVTFPGSNITSHVTGSFSSSSASGAYSGYSGSFMIICGSYLSFGTGTPLGSGTWTAARETATPLSASASADVTSGSSPFVVHFTGTASGGTPPYTYGWDFGDSTSSSYQQNPTHTYKKAGTHTATFYVWDGHNWGATKSITITVTAPPFSTAATASPTSGPAPLAVQFTGSPSGGVSPYTYSWDFGDGSAKSTSQNPTHTYTTAGDYTAKLTAKDDASQSATANVAIHVDPPPPVSVTASADVTSGYAPLTVNFTGGASGGATPYTFSWDFGDGSAASTSQNPTHTYASEGTFTATLTVNEAGGGSGSASVVITVTPAPPITVSAAADVTSGVAPLTVHFTGSASGGTTPYGYSWNFGDGSPSSSSQSPTHTYQGAGSYTATLTVTDSASASGAASVAIAVGAPPAQFVYLVPAVAHNPGAGGTLWRTDIGAVNPGPVWASFTLRFVGAGGGAPFVTSLAPGAAAEWANLLETVFAVAPATSASGAVEIASDHPLVLAARTYNATDTGTYGQYLPALTHADTLSPGQAGILPQLKKSAAFRTNIGAVNHGDAPGTVAIKLLDASGVQVGSTRTITVQPSAWVQHNDVFVLTGAGEQEIAYATVEVTGGALMWVYASVVDEQTGDPTAIPVLRR